MPLFTNYGKPKSTIANYMKKIEQDYIPALNQALGININNYPKIARETYALYEDSETGVGVELSSNHRNIENKGELFLAVVYDGMKEDAGIVNLNNIQEAVENTLYSLQDLGFKTQEQLQAEKEKVEKDRIEAENKRKADALMAKQKREELRKQAEEQAKREKGVEEPVEEPEEDHYDENREDYVKEIKTNLKFLSSTNEGTLLELDWSVIPDSSDSTNISFVHIMMNMTHVSGENFLIETQRIKPKIETIANIDKAIDIANKVSDKLRQTPVMIMKDEKGRDLVAPVDMSDEEEGGFTIDI